MPRGTTGRPPRPPTQAGNFLVSPKIDQSLATVPIDARPAPIRVKLQRKTCYSAKSVRVHVNEGGQAVIGNMRPAEQCITTLIFHARAIRYAHKLAGHPAPTDDERVKATMRGIRRSVEHAPRKKTPATAERIVAMALSAGDDIKGQRDRALLLIGFAGAFRRSELIALDVEDLEESELGFRVTIRHSKTDQEGAGQTIAIVRGSVACPITALKGWLAAAGITSGPIFRSVKRGGAVGGRLPAQSVADIVKRYAERVGLDPAQFAGHSMRSGFLTSAAKRGASIFKMMDQSRHRSVETLRGYVRDAEIFKEHAGAGLL